MLPVKRPWSFERGLRRLGVIGTAAVFLLSFLVPVQALEPGDTAQDGSYHLADFEGGEAELGTFDTYAAAVRAYEKSKEDYGNLAILLNGKVLKAEYAIAKIKATDACDYNVEYTQDVDGLKGYTNGCYGIDAAYLDTNADGTQAEFVLSGVRGWVSLDDIDILPLQNLPSKLSTYTVNGGSLYHQIKTEMDDDYYSSLIDLGAAPAGLNEGAVYYSYDGHYFYAEDALAAMLDDYRSDSRGASVNPDAPFYDYYQFVSHRTITNVSCQNVEDYLQNTLGITSSIDAYRDNDQDSSDDTLNRSQYYGQMPAFYQNQYEYGANALMMLALSANESAYGRSSLSFTRNNLFGHAAYDTDVEKNASRYLNIANSVYAHAKYYISGSYCSPLKTQYHGGFFGNKSAGMNVSYASDPYWGEKAASYYQRLDSQFGDADLNSYTIGIKTSTEDVPVHQYAQADSDVLYQTGTMPDYAFVILGTMQDDAGNGWYIVQSDATLGDDGKVALSYTYDYANDIAYIPAAAVQVILDQKAQKSTAYAAVTFDAAGGTFPGDQALVSYQLPEGSAAEAATPAKANALFTGWDKDTSQVAADTTFTAQYLDVSSIEMSALPKQDYELNDRISLKGGTVRINPADGGEPQYAVLTSSMVSGYDMSADGDQTVTVTYAGCTTDYAIHVSAEKDALRAEIKTKITAAIDAYADQETITGTDAESVLALKKTIDENMQPYLTQPQLRQWDAIVRRALKGRISYIVEKNSYSMQVSGMSASMPLDDSLSDTLLHRYFPDTWRISIHAGIGRDAEAAMTGIAKAQDNSEQEAFTIKLQRNYIDITPQKPILITIAKPAGADAADVFTVLHYDPEDGDVEKCYTRQSTDCITFMAYGMGDFMVISRRTSNEYSGTDPVETVNHGNSDVDREKVLLYCSIAAIALIVLILALHSWQKKKEKDKPFLAEKKEQRIDKLQKDIDDETTALMTVIHPEDYDSNGKEKDHDQHGS